ncbi:MAG: nucleotidyltransferase family protein, partial [Calditrichaeota bacterium]|nr:nucleotidyltransferase family protein [Calditrichota bacterium]
MHHDTQQNGENKSVDSGPSPRRSEAYPFPVDAVVLAGTHRNPKRLIAGRNKAFLEVGGQVLIRYVINALMKAESIDKIFVVGPLEELSRELADYPPIVRVIAQRGKMMTNCWVGIEASEDIHRDDPLMPVEERPLLIISCDLPLVTARSVDDFVARCARVDNASEKPYALLAGVVDEPGVTPF